MPDDSFSPILGNNLKQTLENTNDQFLNKTGTEMGYILTSAHITRLYLILKTDEFGDFPEPFLDGQQPDSELAYKQLAKYTSSIWEHQKQCLSPTGQPDTVLASGLLIWIHSLISAEGTELFPQGQIMWKHLIRGIYSWRDQIVECYPPGMPPTTFRGAWYVPNRFAPHWHNYPSMFM